MMVRSTGKSNRRSGARRAVRGKGFVRPSGRVERGEVVENPHERAPAERMLADSEQRYRLLFESSPVSLYVFQRKTLKILAANERMVQQYGWSREQLARMSMLDLCPPIERAHEAARRRPVTPHEIRVCHHRRRSGEIFEVESTGFDFDYEGQPARLVWALDVSARERTKGALREMAEGMRSLSRRLVSLEEDQRRALARELHDRAGQNLTALAINLEILRDGASRMAPVELERRLRESAALTEATGKMIDDVTVALEPPPLDEYGLATALRWLGEQHAARTGLRIEVRTPEGDGPAPRAERDLALFRIAQEAINNVLRHAHASWIEIALIESQQGLELSVRDDGQGLNAGFEARSRLRHGVRGMRERAIAIGARIELAPAPGRGTVVSVRVAR